VAGSPSAALAASVSPAKFSPLTVGFMASNHATYATALGRPATARSAISQAHSRRLRSTARQRTSAVVTGRPSRVAGHLQLPGISPGHARTVGDQEVVTRR
jgi:hypothetical protein